MFRMNMVCIAAASLAACATSAPTSSTAPAPARVAYVGDLPFVAPQGYREETRNGETYYCKRNKRTGSRSNTTETCYTQFEVMQMSGRYRSAVLDPLADHAWHSGIYPNPQ
jgi:invasion protein IalB